MGQLVSKISRSALREANKYNIEQRAEKVISKEKPTRAPMHPSAVQELERMKEENVSTDYLYKKNQKLDEHLKKVFVTTPDPVPLRLENPVRPLPQARHHRGEMSYGYCEAEEERVPEGKVSLKQALQIITLHQADPLTHSTAAISQQYKLDPKTAGDILEHFKMFNVHFKKKGVDPDSLSEQEKLAMRVQAMTMINASELVGELKINQKSKKYNDNLSNSRKETVLDKNEPNKQSTFSKNDSNNNK